MKEDFMVEGNGEFIAEIISGFGHQLRYRIGQHLENSCLESLVEKIPCLMIIEDKNGLDSPIPGVEPCLEVLTLPG